MTRIEEPFQILALRLVHAPSGLRIAREMM